MSRGWRIGRSPRCSNPHRNVMCRVAQRAEAAGGALAAAGRGHPSPARGRLAQDPSRRRGSCRGCCAFLGVVYSPPNDLGSRHRPSRDGARPNATSPPASCSGTSTILQHVGRTCRWEPRTARRWRATASRADARGMGTKAVRPRAPGSRHFTARTTNGRRAGRGTVMGDRATATGADHPARAAPVAPAEPSSRTRSVTT
jgi:hypothetical protein